MVDGIWDDPNLSAMDIRIHGFGTSFALKQGRSPTVNETAEAVGCQPCTVRRSLANLSAAGYIILGCEPAGRPYEWRAAYCFAGWKGPRHQPEASSRPPASQMAPPRLAKRPSGDRQLELEFDGSPSPPPPGDPPPIVLKLVVPPTEEARTEAREGAHRSAPGAHQCAPIVPPLYTPYKEEERKSDQSKETMIDFSSPQKSSNPVEAPVSHQEFLDNLFQRADGAIEQDVTREQFAAALDQFGEDVIEEGINRAEKRRGIVAWTYLLAIFESVHKEWKPAPMQNQNPPSPKPKPMTRDEVLTGLPSSIDMARQPGIEGRLGLSLIRGYVAQNLVSPSELPGDIQERLVDAPKTPAKKTPAAGRLGKVSPQPAGANGSIDPSVHESPDNSNGTCKTKSFGNQRQRARVDSNHQPSDSKSAHPSIRPGGGHVVPGGLKPASEPTNPDRPSAFESEVLPCVTIPRGPFRSAPKHQRE